MSDSACPQAEPLERREFVRSPISPCLYCTPTGDRWQSLSISVSPQSAANRHRCARRLRTRESGSPARSTDRPICSRIEGTCRRHVDTEDLAQRTSGPRIGRMDIHFFGSCLSGRPAQPPSWRGREGPITSCDDVTVSNDDARRLCFPVPGSPSPS